MTPEAAVKSIKTSKSRQISAFRGAPEAAVKSIEPSEVQLPSTFRAGRDGFTLIEVIISVFVVAFSLVAILEVFNVDIRSSNDARAQLKAAVRAEQLMEQVAQSSPPRSSFLPEIEVESGTISERVTVNVQWIERDSKGSVTIVREFFL